jgi:hypothetical protein
MKVGGKIVTLLRHGTLKQIENNQLNLRFKQILDQDQSSPAVWNQSADYR